MMENKHKYTNMQSENKEQKKTYKVVYHDNWGAYSLTDDIIKWLAENGIQEKYPHLELDPERSWMGWDDIPRHEPLLVRCVANRIELEIDAGSLRVQEIPVPQYFITNNDGDETVWTSQDLITIEEEEPRTCYNCASFRNDGMPGDDCRLYCRVARAKINHDFTPEDFYCNYWTQNHRSEGQ